MHPAIFHGTPPFIMDAPAVSRGGRGMLDSFRARLLCTATWEDDARKLGFEIEKKLSGFPSLWVKSMEPEIEAEDIVVVDVFGDGLAVPGDRRQRKMQCGDRETSVGPTEKIVIVWSADESGQIPETGEPVSTVPRRVPRLDDLGEVVFKDIATPSGTMKRWVVSEQEVSVVDTYFTTSRPAMNAVGQASTPDNAPETPEYPWSGYAEPMRGRHPNGWVLADRDVDQIYYHSDSIGLWRVVDTHSFRHPAFPD